MLTSTPPMVPKTAASVSAAHGYGVDYAHHLQHQHQHQDDQGQESPLPQPQPQSPSPSHFNHTEAARGASEAHLQNTDSGMFARIHSKSASLGSSSSSPQQQRRQSILRHFKTNDVEQIQDAPLSHTKAMSAPPTAQHLETGQDIRPEDRRLVVRLDLRKLGTGLGELRGSRKHSLRRHSKQKPADDVKAGSAHPPTVQTTLSASSWSLAKRAPEPLVQSNSARGSASTPPHLYQTVEGFPAIIADGYTSASTPALDQTTLGNSLFKHHSDAPEHSSDAAGDSRSDDEDYADTCPQAVKRHSPSRASRDPISKKRTRTPDQGTAKKKKLDEDTRRQQPHRPGAGTVKKESSKKPPKGSLALKDAVSVKGDELALKPRRRKRKDAVPLRVDDPEAPNDGDIEVIPDPETTENKRSIWDTDTSGVLFRVPERSIKLSFIEKCQRVREAKVEASLKQAAARSEESSASWRFNLLVEAAVMATEEGLSPRSLIEAQNHVQDRDEDQDKDQGQGQSQNQSQNQIDHEKVQDTVLDRMTDPAERQEYLRFRAFQQYLCEHDVEEAMKQWLDLQKQEKD
ncbi:hypothetical protein BGZ58_002685 [Dissophora ornata]|nr:hypothetical protein BGZ58_002685 [Dissophora ornata]